MKKSAPKNLSNEAKSWWKSLQAEYQIGDQAGLLLLQSALEAFDRMRGAQQIIERDGQIIQDRFGQPRQHPATLIERDSRSQMMQALKALQLDVEPLQSGPGRPPERF